MVRWLVASLHLIALPIGFAAVVVRGAALRGQHSATGVSARQRESDDIVARPETATAADRDRDELLA